MAHQSSSSAESDNQIPSHPFQFNLKSIPQSSKDSILVQEQEISPLYLKGAKQHPFMAHHSSAESGDQIPSHPFDFGLKSSPQSCKDSILEQEQEISPFYLKDVTQQSPSASKTLLCNKEETVLQELEAVDSGREKLKRHRVEVAGRVWIPDMWGQEDLLKDWIDCSAFDAPLVPSKITMARKALVEEGRRANAAGLRIENRC